MAARHSCTVCLVIQTCEYLGSPQVRRPHRAAAQHMGEMLALAKTDTDRRRIGDMLKATRNGAPLPSIEDARREGTGEARVDGHGGGRRDPDQSRCVMAVPARRGRPATRPLWAPPTARQAQGVRTPDVHGDAVRNCDGAAGTAHLGHHPHIAPQRRARARRADNRARSSRGVLHAPSAVGTAYRHSAPPRASSPCVPTPWSRSA